MAERGQEAVDLAKGLPIKSKIWPEMVRSSTSDRRFFIKGREMARNEGSRSGQGWLETDKGS